MAELNEVLQRKIDELDELSVTDPKFKDAASGVCDLAETETKVDAAKSEKKGRFWKWVLAAVAAITPFALSAWDKKHYDAELDKVLEYEKTGAVISTGGKSVLSGLRINKK